MLELIGLPPFHVGMIEHAATSVISSSSSLGEGPVWVDDALWWVDIEAMRLHRWETGQSDFDTHTLPERIGFAIPAVDGTWRIGLQSGIYRYAPDTGNLELIVNPEADQPGNRFNDGKCDPEGRLWAGTMSMSGEKGTGSLYRLCSGSCERMFGPVSISNGLAWDSAKQTFYYVDSPTREVAAFDYTPDSGDIANRRVVWQVPEGEGTPDGMSIDASGNLWVALWGGYGVMCVDPEKGEAIAKVNVPAPQVTSCAFGGKDHDILYMTTARIGLKPEQLEASPLAGNVFAAKPGVTGLPTTLVS